jgi:CheY-like chemotaxis protein
MVDAFVRGREISTGPTAAPVPQTVGTGGPGGAGLPTGSKAERRHKPREAAGQDTTVLLLEDNIINQKVSPPCCGASATPSTWATNGLEALDAMDRVPYPVVFMDRQMPLMDGYQATIQLREREGSANHTHVVAVTASAMEADRIRCFEAGMDDYLTNPFYVEDLAATMEEWRRHELASGHTG